MSAVPVPSQAARTAPFIPITRDLTPGAYMRECRQRANVSVADCARAVAMRGVDRMRATEAIRALEANRPGDYSRIISALRDRSPFPFDFGMFATLAAETADPSMPDVVRW